MMKELMKVKNILLLMVCCFVLAFNYKAFGAEYVNIHGDIEKHSFVAFKKKVDSHKGTDHIVSINSNGGAVFDGLDIISYMRVKQFAGHKFYCVVEQMAASMAAHILQTCDFRFMKKHSTVMQHRIYAVDAFGQRSYPVVASYYDFLMDNNCQDRGS